MTNPKTPTRELAEIIMEDVMQPYDTGKRDIQYRDAKLVADSIERKIREGPLAAQGEKYFSRPLNRVFCGNSLGPTYSVILLGNMADSSPVCLYYVDSACYYVNSPRTNEKEQQLVAIGKRVHIHPKWEEYQKHSTLYDYLPQLADLKCRIGAKVKNEEHLMALAKSLWPWEDGLKEIEPEKGYFELNLKE